MKLDDLVQAAYKASGATSEREFARRVGVSHTAVGKWRDGTSYPSFEQAAAMAALAGLPAAKTAATIRLESREGKKHSAILRKIATAAAVCLAVYTSMRPQSGAAIAAAIGFLTYPEHLMHCAPKRRPKDRRRRRLWYISAPGVY